MKQRQIDRMLLGLSVGCYLIMSVSFLLMPIASMSTLPGALFWLGLVLGSSLQIVLEIRRRDFFRSYAVNRKKMQKPRNGLLSFNSNRIATVVDVILIVNLMATIPVLIMTKGYGYICYLLIAITVFSLCLHCVLNGRIYFHAKNQIKVRQALEQRKTDKGESENEKKLFSRQ